MPGSRAPHPGSPGSRPPAPGSPAPGSPAPVSGSPAPAATATLGILRLLARHPEPLPAAAIARDLGMPRSTAYKLLALLVDEGFVTHLPEERRYGLGVAAFELGSAYTRQAGLARIGRPVLSRLVEETTHNGHLAVLHGRDVLYVLEERAPGRPMLVTDVGVRLPAQLTASGLAMLAALPHAQVRALFPDRGAFVTRGDQGPRTLHALRAALAEVRSRGYAVEVGTVTDGMASVACGVLGAAGHPVAAVAITYPRDAHTAVEPLAAASRQAAHELTRRLGGPHKEHP
nr:IclR family transcriptional regulator [Arsenicicoccus dermatophilus]